MKPKGLGARSRERLASLLRKRAGTVTPMEAAEIGLYVLIKEGGIILVQQDKTLELARGESAFASIDQVQLFRLQFTPIFLERDSALSATSADGLMCTY